MAPPELYVGQAKSNPPAAPDPMQVWAPAQVLGVFLLLAGVIDLGLALLSPAPAEPSWRFATVALLIGGLPLPTLGLLAGVMASIATGHRLRSRIWGVLCLLFSVTVAVGLVAFILALPEIRALTPVESLADLDRTATRTVAVGLVFLLLLGYAGLKGVSYTPNT